MSEDNYDDHEEREESDLPLSKQLELEDLMVRTAFNNSFNVLTNRTTFNKILDGKTINGASAIMAHNPDEDIPLESLENMMAYFVESEEYEKCAEIKDIMEMKENIDQICKGLVNAK